MIARRGAAMLLVLMTCTVLIVGVTIIARVQASASIASSQASSLARCDQLITAAEQPIMQWLVERSGSITVDPSLGSPIVKVHDDLLVLDSSQIHVQITAWDQQGMWPRNSDQLGFTPPVSGIQLSEIGHHLYRLQLDSSVFPTESDPIAIGGLVATHNPWPVRSRQTRRRGAVSINVNTAPQALLNQISARYDVGDLSSLVEGRRLGERVELSQTARNAEGEEIQLVSVSRVWSIRTQVTVDRVTRSVWSVYTNQGGQWQLVQRTVIGEPNG